MRILIAAFLKTRNIHIKNNMEEGYPFTKRRNRYITSIELQLVGHHYGKAGIL